MIVVFSVIAILSSIGIVASVNYSRAQSLEAASQDLRTVLNQAKSYAQSQYKPSECNNENGVLEYYRVELVKEAGGYTGEYTLSVKCGGWHQITEASLPKDVYFDKNDTTSALFDYMILTGGIRSDGNASSPWTIKLVGNVGGRFKIITLDSIGFIQ
jgi:type II secretory pathway pseudopilin PulG